MKSWARFHYRECSFMSLYSTMVDVSHDTIYEVEPSLWVILLYIL